MKSKAVLAFLWECRDTTRWVLIFLFVGIFLPMILTNTYHYQWIPIYVMWFALAGATFSAYFLVACGEILFTHYCLRADAIPAEEARELCSNDDPLVFEQRVLSAEEAASLLAKSQKSSDLS